MDFNRHFCAERTWLRRTKEYFRDFNAMRTHWRLFKNTTRSVSTAEGLAVDDTLPQSVANHGSPPILHLYTFVPSVIVGKYQDNEAALKLDRCRARGIESA